MTPIADQNPEAQAPADLRPRGVSRRHWRRLNTLGRAGDYAPEVLSLALMVVVVIGFEGYVARRVLEGEIAVEDHCCME